MTRTIIKKREQSSRITEEAPLAHRWKRFASLFDISRERQQKVYEQIKEEALGDIDFWTLTVLSGIIVTLGLIVNSATVIIGGMLLAPLFWPVLAIAIATVRGYTKLFESGMFTLAKASVVILIVSFILGLFSPFTSFGNEILLRTQPTIFELFIALAVGFVGAFVVVWPGLTSAIAGVAIAVALVPPLATVGIGLASKAWYVSGSALLLYLTNLFAVVLAAILFFMFADFEPPTTEIGQQRKKKRIVYTLVLVAFVAVMLTIVTGQTVHVGNQRDVAQEVIASSLRDFLGIDVRDVSVRERRVTIEVDAVVRASQNIDRSKVNAIAQKLQSVLGKEVSLRITVVPTYDISSGG